jgi:hypothetical protein
LSKYLNGNALRKNKMRINLAILNHNLENFSLDIIEYCLPKDVIKREQYYLDTYKPFYNTLKIAGSSLGYVHNETSLAKMRKAKGIPVKVIDIDNKKIIIYASKKEAGLHLNTNNTTIGRYIKSGKLLFGKYLITEIG